MELHHLVQALHQTRTLAAARSDDAGWQDLAQQVDDLLALLTTDAHDPTTPAMGAQRLDRTVAVDQDQAQHTVAALSALFDRPDDTQLGFARDAVRDLGDSIRG